MDRFVTIHYVHSLLKIQMQYKFSKKQIQMHRKNTRLLESKYKMAEVTGPKYCMYNSSKLCSAEGSEVDTLFVFL